MAIVDFTNRIDGLEPHQRNREHFIADMDLEDDRLWVPYSEGVWFQPCHFNVTSGGFSVIAKALPGAIIGTHYHVGTVQAWTIAGHWYYLEHDWVAKPGTFVFEPAGGLHTLVIPADSPGPMITLFVVTGAQIYMDKSDTEQSGSGKFGSYEDGFTMLEMSRQHYREVGLDPTLLDARIR
jgi:2,4'-dihydroxyacetophenone dioxygenase